MQRKYIRTSRKPGKSVVTLTEPQKQRVYLLLTSRGKTNEGADVRSDFYLTVVDYTQGVDPNGKPIPQKTAKEALIAALADLGFTTGLLSDLSLANEWEIAGALDLDYGSGPCPPPGSSGQVIA